MAVQIKEGATWIRTDQGHTQGPVLQEPGLREAGPGRLLQGPVLDRPTLGGGVPAEGGRAHLELVGGGEALVTAVTAALVTEAEAQVGPEVAQGGGGDKRHWEFRVERGKPHRYQIAANPVSGLRKGVLCPAAAKGLVDCGFEKRPASHFM